MDPLQGFRGALLVPHWHQALLPVTLGWHVPARAFARPGSKVVEDDSVSLFACFVGVAVSWTSSYQEMIVECSYVERTEIDFQCRRHTFLLLWRKTWLVAPLRVDNRVIVPRLSFEFAPDRIIPNTLVASVLPARIRRVFACVPCIGKWFPWTTTAPSLVDNVASHSVPCSLCCVGWLPGYLELDSLQTSRNLLSVSNIIEWMDGCVVSWKMNEQHRVKDIHIQKTEEQAYYERTHIVVRSSHSMRTVIIKLIHACHFWKAYGGSRSFRFVVGNHVVGNATKMIILLSRWWRRHGCYSSWEKWDDSWD